MSIQAHRSWAGRKPRKYTAGRTCAFEQCEILLSTYNKKKFCFNHAPKTYPRVRGHITLPINNEGRDK
mgnify:CR=1 FL=1|tara:strand:- start:1106 stop:1309 length:204 start_codon:yes stop_codon:yes gene_type:complete